MGYQAMEASTAAAAASIAERAVLAVILCDNHLGAGMGGAEFLRSTEQRHPETRCILMSGAFDMADSRPHGFNFLPKPFTREMLMTALRGL